MQNRAKYSNVVIREEKRKTLGSLKSHDINFLNQTGHRALQSVSSHMVGDKFSTE